MQADIALAYEAIRAPLGNLAYAARRANDAAEELEWALWASDPENEDRPSLDSGYVRKRLLDAEPAFRAAMLDLRVELETGIGRLLEFEA